MKTKTKKFLNKLSKYKKNPQRGSAIVVATLILILLTVYVSTSLTLATSDAVSSNFGETQRRGYFTAFSKLEQMSRDFSGLFITSLNPTYDSMCRVVVSTANLTNLNGFNVSIPNVDCSGPNCTAMYTGKLSDAGNVGSDLYDLGWVGQNINPAVGFCVVDVCNPTAGTNCMIPARPPNAVQINSGVYSGLQGFARRYRQVARAINPGGVDTQITRDFDNILLPLFQFGIFTDSDFELYLPPNWAFGGWVHTNGNFYVTNNTPGPAPNTILFSQYAYDATGMVVPTQARITAGKHMILGTEKSGRTANSIMQVFNGLGYVDITQGDVTGGANRTCIGIGPTLTDPAGTGCTGFTGNSQITLGAPTLRLPIQNILGVNPIELVKRGLASDFAPTISSPLVSARYAYKPGIRVTLADYQSQLPRTVKATDTDPTAGTGPYGGIQLDGPDPILGTIGGGLTSIISTGGANPSWYYQKQSDGKARPIPRGYQPKVLNPNTGVARPSGARVNGFRLHGWIKIEVVKAITGQTYDVTEEMMNLGVTVPYMANRAGASVYFPRANANVDFPTTLPLAYGAAGPYPDENSVIHLQRMAVPYVNTIPAGTALPATLATNPTLLPQGLDDVTSSVVFDYYSSMALGTYNENATLKMYGIEDNIDGASYLTRLAGGVASYAEPQLDKCGYYTDVAHQPLPDRVVNLTASKIDFSQPAPAGLANARTGLNFLSENVNLPKSTFPTAVGPATTDTQSIIYQDGETTWTLNDATATKHRLIPFPINMFDSREGTPHEPDNITNAQVNGNAAAGNDTDTPVPGIGRTSVSKVGTMNLVEIDMGNLGRLLNGDFDRLFAQMGNTAFFQAQGRAFVATDILDNISINQDNGWLVYISDRRGDEPVVSTNPYFPTAPDAVPVPGKPSLIGNGEYHKENVIWSQSGTTTAGVEDGLLPMAGCIADNKDDGKSPQDSNNNCQIDSETAANGYSETAPYNAYFNQDQMDPTLVYPAGGPGTIIRDGNMIGLTEVPTNPANAANAWSLKPPVVVQGTSTDLRRELFRRGVRVVNAASIFPTGQSIVVHPCGVRFGVTVITENPVYVFGNYNAPAGNYPIEGVNDLDPNPGVNAMLGSPTSPANYQGQSFTNPGFHVPSAIVADSITLLSNPNVGNSNPGNWVNGWLDTRSFMSPYQSLSYRSARTTTYRFALISGYTPTWFNGYWGSGTRDQGGGTQGSQTSSGALNNFPRFLEDWGVNGTGTQRAIYAGSLIRIYKSRQGTGAFKRVSNAGTLNAVDYVYRPPNRDWTFDVDFNSPCTLPPGSPFLQLLDFKGFQESVIQR